MRRGDLQLQCNNNYYVKVHRYDIINIKGWNNNLQGFARAMLDFVQARKNLFLNPFDFLCQQAMSNSLKSLLAANTALVSALDTLRQAMEEDDADDENGKVSI